MSTQSSTHLEVSKPDSLVKVILGSATGTMIEWNDFYIFGSLAAFAVGFLVRPFGALFFGRIGDLVGRRIAFIITLTVMGFSTASIGLLPTFETAGWLSPVILIFIRVLQGL